MNEWMNEWMNERMNESLNGRVARDNSIVFKALQTRANSN